MSKIVWILIFLVLNFSALGIGNLLMNNGPTSNWYMELNKAPWTPPGWFFGVAWTTIMICFSIYMSFLIVQKPNSYVLSLFIIQFLLNIFWNYAFFNQHLVGLGLLVILLLTLVVGYFLITYTSQLSQISLLIVPYFVWLIVASSLNAYVYFNN
ncbi:MAG: tryptophan-rich sensory protein [Lutibacter sp.]|jgi:translocator protein|nr:tryptophan-rich sensory protein [Lutibacter sp.]